MTEARRAASTMQTIRDAVLGGADPSSSELFRRVTTKYQEQLAAGHHIEGNVSVMFNGGIQQVVPRSWVEGLSSPGPLLLGDMFENPLEDRMKVVQGIVIEAMRTVFDGADEKYKRYWKNVTPFLIVQTQTRMDAFLQKIREILPAKDRAGDWRGGGPWGNSWGAIGHFEGLQERVNRLYSNFNPGDPCDQLNNLINIHKIVMEPEHGQLKARLLYRIKAGERQSFKMALIAIEMFLGKSEDNLVEDLAYLSMKPSMRDEGGRRLAAVGDTLADAGDMLRGIVSPWVDDEDSTDE